MGSFYPSLQAVGKIGRVLEGVKADQYYYELLGVSYMAGSLRSMSEKDVSLPLRLFPNTSCGVDIPIQRDFGYLKRPADILN
jgi:hypothetical protein